jgi:hypothetical protein
MSAPASALQVSQAHDVVCPVYSERFHLPSTFLACMPQMPHRLHRNGNHTHRFAAAAQQQPIHHTNRVHCVFMMHIILLGQMKHLCEKSFGLFGFAFSFLSLSCLQQTVGFVFFCFQFVLCCATTPSSQSPTRSQLSSQHPQGWAMTSPASASADTFC